MNLKKKIELLDLGITELSIYLDVSRPTLYKFIEMYESNTPKKIPMHIKNVFEYIKNNDDLTKIKVISFINSMLQNKNENESLVLKLYKSKEFKMIFDFIIKSTKIKDFEIDLYNRTKTEIEELISKWKE